MCLMPTYVYECMENGFSIDDSHRNKLNILHNKINSTFTWHIIYRWRAEDETKTMVAAVHVLNGVHVCA